MKTPLKTPNNSHYYLNDLQYCQLEAIKTLIIYRNCDCEVQIIFLYFSSHLRSVFVEGSCQSLYQFVFYGLFKCAVLVPCH